MALEINVMNRKIDLKTRLLINRVQIRDAGHSPKDKAVSRPSFQPKQKRCSLPRI